MKYNWSVKLMAILLAVVSVICVVVSGLCVAGGFRMGWYFNSPEEWQAERLYDHGYHYGSVLAERYAFLESGMSRTLWEETFAGGWLGAMYYPQVDYVLTIVRPDGSRETENTCSLPEGEYIYHQEVTVSVPTGFAEQVINSDLNENPSVPNATVAPGETAPTEATTEPVETTEQEPEPSVEDTNPSGAIGEAACYLWRHATDGSSQLYAIYRYEEPLEITMELYYTQGELEQVVGSREVTPLVTVLYEHRNLSLGVLVGSVLVLLLMLLYLGIAAGRKPEGGEVYPRGMNRLPLDLYTAADCFLGIGLVYLLVMAVDGLVYLETYKGEVAQMLVSVILGLSGLIGLICVLYWCAFWAQVKAPGGYWLKNTLVVRCGKGIWKLVCIVFRWMLSPLTGAWNAFRQWKQGGRLTEAVRAFWDRLPLTWQWLSVSGVFFLAMAVVGPLCDTGIGMIFYIMLLIFAVFAVIYAANAFGALRDGAKRMSQGDLNAKVNADALEGCFRDFALDLNALSETCVVAARDQMRSERMKTELITNVSHDIKTPLTSIINYVDLLQQAETEEQRTEYLAVLERQSVRLKKLIEDLMEMSRASSGNVAAEIQPTDVVESVNQALGEFSDRFDALGLQILFRHREEQVTALCDGRLLWRVLSNVLTNVAKYALPGTRVYVDLEKREEKVFLSVKNISREALNITAEELMERFVRGDESRNTEGNGLGLNIAKSLMEVQNGALDLMVDGDLFKVVLTLPVGL